MPQHYIDTGAQTALFIYLLPRARIYAMHAPCRRSPDYAMRRAINIH